MPPIPVTLDEQTRLSMESLQRRINDLVKFQIPRLRQCTGPLAIQQRLNAEVRDDIDACTQQVEALDISVDDQDSELNRRELRRLVVEYQKQLAELRKDSRSALLASKQAIDARSSSNRDELLQSSVIQEHVATTTADDTLMKANNDVTQALQRTMGIMQGELEKSILSNQLLEQSSASLRAASSQHDTLSLVMGTSKQLIVALERSDWLDRMLIISGLVFFALCVLLVLKQRILDRSIRIAFWWTRFLPDSSGVEVLDKVEQGGDSLSSILITAASTVIGSVASSMTSLLPSPSSATKLQSELVDSSVAMPVYSSTPLPSSPLDDEPATTSINSDSQATSGTRLPLDSEPHEHTQSASVPIERDEL